MSYNREEILQQCIEVIKREKLIFFDDLGEFVAPARSTLYLWELEKSDDIKNALYKNRVATKRKLRNNWTKDEAPPVLQLAAYKLMADNDELAALTMSRVDQRFTDKDGNDISPIQIKLDAGNDPIKRDQGDSGIPG